MAKTRRKTTKTKSKKTSRKLKNKVDKKSFWDVQKEKAGKVERKVKKSPPKSFLGKLFSSKNKKRIIFFGGLIAIFTWLFWGIPLPTNLESKQVPVSTKLFDRNGNLIYEIYADKRSTPVDLGDLPDHVKNATISIEDKDFYKHYGVSIQGILRASYNTVFKRKLQGGSTLTQQLVKNSLLTPERTVKRKIREFALTMAVEALYTKNQILESYLNQIPYGSTAYGIGAASELYFRKSANDLTLAEAALLAGLPQSPTRYSPFGTDSGRAKGRQEVVLSRMVEDGYITQEEMDEALKEELHYAKAEAPKAPHFALWVKEQLADEYGDAVVEQGGLRVTTTLDLELQEFAQDAVATEVAKLKSSNVGNGAAIVTRPGTGEILAMVGSKDYFAEDEDGKVNIIFAERQPGSSIKPLNYALGILDENITPSTPLADVPTCFSVLGQAAYCPVNYDGSYHGAVQARFALGNSYNIPAVRVLALNGIENFFDFARSMGITTWTDPANYGLSLTLGGGEVKPFDMAIAFGVFANAGEKVPLISILKVENYKGEVLEETATEKIKGERIIPESVAFLVSHILHDNNARSAAFGSSSFLNVRNHPEISVKTGTTNDLRDNWTVGYTADAVTVVWVGNNDNSAMSRAVSGVSGASPIWNRIMGEVQEKAESGFYDDGENHDHPWPEQPDDVVGATVCVTNGNRVDDPNNPGCPTRFEYFLSTKVGSQIGWGQSDLAIDKTTQALAHPELPPELIEPQNHPYLNDPLGTLVCLDCPIASHSATIGYPLRRI
jgi:penicillin-binding protein 1C